MLGLSMWVVVRARARIIACRHPVTLWFAWLLTAQPQDCRGEPLCALIRLKSPSVTILFVFTHRVEEEEEEEEPAVLYS